MTQVGIIARVSTRDQESDNQLIQMRDWCRANGHDIAGEYVDVVSGSAPIAPLTTPKASGGKGLEKRPELQRAFDDAAAGRFKLALFWSLDRFTRGGLAATVQGLQRFNDAGCGWRSHAEPYLSTESELARDILLAVLSALAKQERIRISERTKAGMDRVRQRGTKSGRPIGRPALPGDTIREIADLAAAGGSINSIAKRLVIDRKTVRRYLPVQNAA